MSTATLQAPQFAQTRSSIASGVLGMIFLLTTETMLFAAFISAYIVNRSAIPQWQPANQPRLPVEITGVNTLILLTSGVLLYFFAKKFRSTNGQGANSFLLLSMVFGGTFLAIQGTEWVRLISYGLNSNTSLYAAFFYLIIGTHALHVVVGMLILAFLYSAVRGARSFENKVSVITTCSMYWAFVVAVWPLLYYLVYVS